MQHFFMTHLLPIVNDQSLINVQSHLIAKAVASQCYFMQVRKVIMEMALSNMVLLYEVIIAFRQL